MPPVTFETLGCQTTFSGSTDEVILEVRIDGAGQREPYILTRSLSSGDAYTIEREYFFTQSIGVTLRWLNDDGPDKIVSDTIAAGGAGSVTFDKDGASYELTYTITPSNVVDPLQRTIEGFEQSNESPQWSGLGPKEALTARVENLVDHSMIVEGVPEGPSRLDQDGANLCGPAAVGFTFALKFPRRFVEMVRSLYEQGAFLGSTSIYEADDALRRHPFPDRVVGASGGSTVDWESVWDDLEMHPLDWMVMAGVGEIQDALSIHRPGEIPDALEWLEDVLGYSTTGIAKPELYQVWNVKASRPWTREEESEEMLREGNDALESGGIAFLLVEASEFWRQWDLDPEGYRDFWRNEMIGPSFTHLVTMANCTWDGQGGTHEIVVHDNGHLRHRPVTADDLEEWLGVVITGEP